MSKRLWTIGRTCILIALILLITKPGSNLSLAEANIDSFNACGIVNRSLSVDPTGRAEGFSAVLYDNSNGLPTAEANDIVQTSEGFIWIGSYSGLVRYDGRTFERMDSTTGITSVVCLLVDSRDRLWIGTNDNGLAIVIREKVVNVLDQSSGLPSNSVRCIIRASDGYYYVGTTGSLQMLVMNNGLKVANTLQEINYADSISADEHGHVAAIASGGRLFLLSEGIILCSMQLTDGQELFNCCAFAPDGTLMVGSSTNHIYRYDVSDGDFTLLDVMTCEDVASINNLNYLDDGTLFISTDSGISYVDAAGYHQMNTNDFNNSIDNMLYDYQGNLWFTSSRLGLLRLAKSAFKDVYGTIGMERRVVNAIVLWQGSYYIGTDKGLDFLPFVESAHLAKKIYLLEGTGTDKILPFLKEKQIAYSGPYGSLKEMLVAVKADLPELAGNETTLNIVFSPGATSFGMFTNEFDRGNQFKALVKESF